MQLFTMFSYYALFFSIEFRVSPLTPREELVTTHDADYVDRYLSGDMTELENRNIGFPWR